jgi:hypothetical protein
MRRSEGPLALNAVILSEISMQFCRHQQSTEILRFAQNDKV